MKYDFTSVIERKGKDALAVDILPNMFGMKDKVEVRRDWTISLCGLQI